MFLPTLNYRHSPLIILAYLLLPAVVMGQFGTNVVGSVTVYVQGPDGGPIDQLAVAVLTSVTGQLQQQATTRGGTAEFTDVTGGNYTVSVIASGYERSVEQLQVSGIGANIVTIRMKPAADGRPMAAATGPPVLAPQAKKELGKALEAMRSGKLMEAHNHLVMVYRLAPGNPDVNYVFGLYCAQVNEWTNAKSYWEKPLSKTCWRAAFDRHRASAGE